MDINASQQARIVRFRLKPNFEVVKKYLYLHWTDEDWKCAIKIFKKNKNILYSYNLNYEPNGDFENCFLSILASYDLSAHVDDLAFLCLEGYQRCSRYLHEQEEYSRDITTHQANSEDEVDSIVQLINLVNGLLWATEGDFKLRLQGKQPKANRLERKRLPFDYNITSTSVTTWLRKIVKDAIDRSDYPHLNLNLLRHSGIAADEKTNVLTFKLSEHAYVQRTHYDRLHENAILTFIAPILNYLEGETSLKKGSIRFASAKQLYFVLELCYLTGLANSSDKVFIPGHSKPTQKDRLDLKALLYNRARDAKNNKKKQHQSS